MPIQSYVTDEELEQILRVIDVGSEQGKRDRAIILLAILNARPRSDSPEVFLRLIAPRTGLTDAVSIGCMFQQYQKKAGIYRHAFDGKGFHGLRRRLAKKTAD